MSAGDGTHGPDAKPVAAIDDVTRRLDRARGLMALPPCVNDVGVASEGLYDAFELRGAVFDGPFGIRLFAVVEGGLERDLCPRGLPIVMDGATACNAEKQRLVSKGPFVRCETRTFNYGDARKLWVTCASAARYTDLETPLLARRRRL